MAGTPQDPPTQKPEVIVLDEGAPEVETNHQTMHPGGSTIASQ